MGRLVLVGLIVASAMTSSTLSTTAAQRPSEPESYLLSLINDERARAGRVALRWDSRLADVAQWRSDDMVERNYFGHTSWEKLTNRVAAEGIAWYSLAETLFKGTPRTAMESAEEAIGTWRSSDAHWDLLSSADYNYVALGVARASDGWYYWTALLIKGPDRTPPVADMTDFRSGGSSGGLRDVTVSWTGKDIELSVLTAGLKDFRIQMRVGSESWTAASDWTTTTDKSFALQPGKTYAFRVKARDKNGNRGIWSEPMAVTP